ncbi:uncharacterized protein LOC125490456 [Plutella xylostella]|uniref:uncharacterized protein LOC125490456 n=1 Tax=Plutella xylostella TaxID=51655 RepID=UPI002032CEAA|nr:uncharacterized protein LOC125490456 [Plutella xylostella]
MSGNRFDNRMLHRFRSLRERKRPPMVEKLRQRRLSEERQKIEIEQDDDVDVAFDVSLYFSDDMADPWREKDAIERERLSLHQQLRDVVSSGDAAQLKGRLAALGRQAGLVVNMTPGGANTLLYM